MSMLYDGFELRCGFLLWGKLQIPVFVFVITSCSALGLAEMCTSAVSCFWFSPERVKWKEMSVQTEMPSSVSRVHGRRTVTASAGAEVHAPGNPVFEHWDHHISLCPCRSHIPKTPIWCEFRPRCDPISKHAFSCAGRSSGTSTPASTGTSGEAMGNTT